MVGITIIIVVALMCGTVIAMTYIEHLMSGKVNMFTLDRIEKKVEEILKILEEQKK